MENKEQKTADEKLIQQGFIAGFKNDQIAIYLRKKGYQTDVLRFTTNQTVNIDILYASKEDIKAILFYMNNVEV